MPGMIWELWELQCQAKDIFLTLLQAPASEAANVAELKSAVLKAMALLCFEAKRDSYCYPAERKRLVTTLLHRVLHPSGFHKGCFMFKTIASLPISHMGSHACPRTPFYQTLVRTSTMQFMF